MQLGRVQPGRLDSAEKRMVSGRPTDDWENLMTTDRRLERVTLALATLRGMAFGCSSRTVPVYCRPFALVTQTRWSGTIPDTEPLRS